MIAWLTAGALSSFNAPAPRPFVTSRAHSEVSPRRLSAISLLSNATRDALSAAASSGAWQDALTLLKELPSDDAPDRACPAGRAEST